MPLPRYERERQQTGSPKEGRAFLYFFGFALLIGVILGAVWVIAGLIHIAFFR